MTKSMRAWAYHPIVWGQSIKCFKVIERGFLFGSSIFSYELFCFDKSLSRSPWSISIHGHITYECSNFLCESADLALAFKVQTFFFHWSNHRALIISLSDGKSSFIWTHSLFSGRHHYSKDFEEEDGLDPGGNFDDGEGEDMDIPPERPNWGFGTSRSTSRLEDLGYLNGYESDEQPEDRSPSRNSHYYRLVHHTPSQPPLGLVLLMSAPTGVRF